MFCIYFITVKTGKNKITEISTDSWKIPIAFIQIQLEEKKKKKQRNANSPYMEEKKAQLQIRLPDDIG